MGVIMHKGIAYGGGSNVEANPAGSATDDLSKLGIDGTVYDITDADAVHSTDIGVASGVAGLDSNGKVPTAQLPTYPTVNNGTMTIQKNGSTVATFTANQSGNATANISVPTQPSDINAAAESDIESTQTTSGNPLTLTDAAPINAESLAVELEPIQDLHGYSNPWVGGAGKNKLQCFATTDVKGNVTFTVNADGTCKVNGTADLWNAVYNDYATADLKAGVSYTLTSEGRGAQLLYCDLKKNGTKIASTDYSDSATFTLDEDATVSLSIVVYYNKTVSNQVIKPMIRLSTETDPTFAPYSNICPISGYDEVEVLDRGVNQWDEEWELGALNTSTGELTSSTTYFRSKNPISVEPQTTYRFKMANVFGYCFYDKDGNFISGSSSGTLSQNITSPANAKILRFFCKGTTYGNNISINYPSTFTEYVPYESTTTSITFGQTVYGGTVDFKTGVVTVDRALLDLGTDATFEYVSALAVDNIFPFRVSNRKYDSAAIAPISDKIKVTKKTSWSIDENEIIYIDQQDSMRIRIPNCTTVAQIETATTGMHLCYELATPTTLKLTPQELKLLQNTNNISSNGTTITLGYQPNNVVGELKGEIEQAANNFTYALLMSDETSCSLAYTDDYTSINVEIPLVQTYTDTQTQQNYTVDYTNCEFAINGVDIICADYQHDWVLGAEWKVIPQIGSVFKQDGKLKVSVYLRNWKLTSSDNTIRYVMLMLDTLAFGKYIDSRTL